VLPTPEGSSYRSYHYEEWTIPAGQGLYLLGAAAYDGRRLVMRRPVTEPGRERPFIISTRSEKQLRRQAMLLMAGGYGLGGLLLAGAALAAVLGAG
jgi:hypothetical protein